MIHSNNRKKALSGWLIEKESTIFNSALKFQKYLFFYEVICKIKNQSHDFHKLKGYINGPVFSDVYGDYTYERDEFAKESIDAYETDCDVVNERFAKISSFLVKILNEDELSELTHGFNIWKAKESFIRSRQQNVILSVDDLDQNDEDLMNSLIDMYPIDYIEGTKVIQISNKNFIINIADISKLNEESKKAFIPLADCDDLQNPVYVSVTDEGVVLVD